MQLYAGTSSDFISDATRNGIAGRLGRAFLDAFHYKPSHQEVQSWQNSLFRMAFALQEGNFRDHGVLLEYQLPLSSRRLDCMLTGHSDDGQPYSVIVELKQWSDVEESNADDCVTTWVAGSKRDILHPSRQVGQYEEYLRDMHSVFVRGEVGLRSCAFLHNLTYDPANEIYAPRHANVLKQYPAFTGDRQDDLITYMGDHLRAGRGEAVLDQVLKSKFAPSKKLLEHTAKVVQDQKAYVLLDSQQVVFSKVLAEAREGANASKLKKTVVLVHGGPGTGKSVIALHLLGRLSGEGLKTMHLTGSKAFTENMRKLVAERHPTYAGLLSAVTRTVSAQPLTYLQNFGGGTDEFLYDRPKRGWVRLKPGVTYCFRRFQPLVQQLARSHWVDHVKGNRQNHAILGDVDDLEDFLFSTSRQSLVAMAQGLRKLEGASCFYCGAGMTSVDVDHFIPFAQYPRDIAHNFVLAHPTCNRSKSDMLAAKSHLAKWLERLEHRADDLTQLGVDAGLLADAAVCRRVASWGYSTGLASGGAAWVAPNSFEPIDATYIDCFTL